jgi:hypothetical protein
MKTLILWQILVEGILLGTVFAQDAAKTSYGLLDVITAAEGGLQALNSANARQSSLELASVASSLGLGDVISVAESGLGALNSANSAQSSQEAARSRGSVSGAASQSSPTQSSMSASRSLSSAPSAGSTSQLTQAKPTSPSSASSAAASSAAAQASSNGVAGNKHRTLTIVLATVLSILALAIIILALVCCLTRRRQRQKRFLRRTLTPESDEVDSWRHQPGQEMQYAQIPALNTTGGAFLNNGRPSSHPYPVVAPDPSLHPAMRDQHVPEYQNPFTPVPPPPRKGAPNARPGLTDGTVPGDAPFIGAASAAVMSRPRSRSSSRKRVRSGIDSTYSSLDPDTRAAPPNSGLNNHPTSIPATDLPPPHTDRNGYREGRPATPMALTGFGASVGHIGAFNPDAGPAGARDRHYAPYHDYEYHPPPPQRRNTGTPPLIPSRSPKRVSFSNSGSGSHNGTASNSNSETASAESAGWRVSQMPGSFDTPQSGPPTPTRGSHGYFASDQVRRSYDGNGNGNGNGGRRLRLSDLRQQEERDWYLRNHQDGYGVGTAM